MTKQEIEQQVEKNVLKIQKGQVLFEEFMTEGFRTLEEMVEFVYDLKGFVAIGAQLELHRYLGCTPNKASRLPLAQIVRRPVRLAKNDQGEWEWFID